jgi:hypothetical protein
MELYVGMDVSLNETSIRVVDSSGEIVSEGTGSRSRKRLPNTS